MRFIKLTSLVGACLCLFSAANTLAQTTSTYNHNELFNPITWPTTGSETRSASGQPGPKYWQNKSDYEIHATLNELAKDTTISGEVTIKYTNNSPDNLDYLWMQLDQDMFKPGSRGDATTPVEGNRFGQPYPRGGYHISSVTVTYKGQSYTVTPVISDARMQVRLKTPLGANGDKISVKVNYDFSIPFYGADRMGRKTFKQGVVYEIAQWYPRMCVYDDVEGWNTLPYMGLGEFYCDYGDFDYYITAPGNMTVVASGDLQNPQEVMTATQQERMAKMKASDKTVSLITPDEVGQASSHVNKLTLTWHFKMNGTRDVSWAASKAFIWDGAQVNFPSGRKGIAMSAYPAESAKIGWTRSTEYLKASMEIYSKEYYEYPWNSAVNVSGVALGMEYPGIIFCMSTWGGEQLWGDVTHEIGHNWFPMIVGSNERKYMWQDEGFNTFINQYSTKMFNKGEYDHPEKRPAMELTVPMSKMSNTLMTPSEAMGVGNGDYGMYYVKTSLGLDILRNEVLGHDIFDYTFHEYIKRWALKHPTPYDFFRSMNDASGEDLNWFFKEWFFTTWNLDQSIKSVEHNTNDAANVYRITLVNNDKMAMPVSAKITQENGKTEIIHLPVNIWQREGTWTFRYTAESGIKSVELDPDHQLPDINRTNNVWNK